MDVTKCPHCGGELKLNSVVEHNVAVYQTARIGVALCCGVGIRVAPVMRFNYTVYTGPDDTDSWLNPIKKVTK